MDNIEDMDFAERLNNYLLHRGWQKSFVEKTVGIPYNTLYSWSTGKRTPPKWQQIMIFNALNRVGLPEKGVDNAKE